MGLDISKLNNVKRGADGAIKAGCPACFQMGQDKRQEHLFIYPDGRFGCAKYQRDKSHRSVIAKLVGDGATIAAARQMPFKPLEYAKSTIKKHLGTEGTPVYNLRALHEKFIVSIIDTTARVIGLGKPVPFVPFFDKSLSDNESEEKQLVPTEIVAQIRADCRVGGWVRGLEEAFDARIVGAVWDCEVYGDMETEAK